MKGFVISALLVGGVLVAVTPVMSTVYADAYPRDPDKRQALEACIQTERGFNRLMASDRASCYQRVLRAVQPAAARVQGHPSPLASANFIDLYRASGRGHMPQNDIRFEQQNADSVRQIHALD